MKAFGQNSTNIFKYLDKMSAKFQNWSETIGKSEGFKKFIDYMQKNGPVIMQLIGNIIKLLFAFGKAIAPIASAILKVVTKVIGFTAALMENHPWIAKVAAVAAILFGAIWSLAVPLIAVNSFLGLFDLSLLKLAKRFLTSGAATKIFSGVINLLKGAIGFLLNPIGNLVKLLPLLSGAFTALTGPVGIVIGIIVGLVGAVVYLWKTNEDFRNFITKAWEDLTKAIGDAIEGIISWFQELWSNIQSTLKPIMPILESLGQVFSKVFGIQVMLIISQVIIAFQTLWTVIQIAGQIIGTIISIAVNTIVSLFTALIQFLTGDFGGAWQTLKNMVSTNLELIWQAILNIWDIITGYLSSVLNRILGIFGTSWQQIWSTVSSKVSQIWSTITSKFSALVGSISGFVSKWVSKIVNGFNQMVSNAANGMARFINKIIDGFVGVVSSVGEGVSNAVSKARSFVSDFVQAGVDLISGMIQGVIDKAKDLAQAAWDAAKGALSAAKSALGIHSPSREFRSLGMYSMIGLGNGIAQFANKAARESRLAAIKVMDAFKVDLSSGITEGLGSSLKNDINAHMTKEIRHSMQENNRPIVNIEVRNEADIELIKTQIDDISARENAIGQF